MHFAVTARSFETVSMLYHLGASLLLKTFQGDTPLHLACMLNDGVMVQLLIAGKAEIETKNADNLTTLQFAAKRGLPDAINTLLAYGASVETKDNRKQTAFQLAVVGGNVEAARTFLEPLSPPPTILQKQEPAAETENEESVPEVGSKKKGKQKDASGVALPEKGKNDAQRSPRPVEKEKKGKAKAKSKDK